jgi:hypothetical protein
MKTITLISKKKIILISTLLLVTIAFSQTTQTFNSSGTFTVPAGVTTVSVQAWGAGGAGGGNTTTADGAGGGGGGAYSSTPLLIVAPGDHTVTVGAGGLGVAGGIGQNGEDSWFGTATTVLAKGGNGGNPPVSGNGGIGGNGGAAASGFGTTKFSGGNGGRGRNNNTGHGGPGATSAGTLANGTSGAATWTAITAPTPVPVGAGAGAAGGSNTNNGSDNTASPGGGGGGAGDKNSGGSPNTIGGFGADGQVIVSWICPTYALTINPTNNGPFCNVSSATITLQSATLPSGTYTVTYNLSGATTATGNTATMTFTAGSPGTGTISTPVLNVGTTTVTITNLASGAGCSTVISSFNTTDVNIVAPATAVAGTNIAGCSTTPTFNITAGSSASNYSSVTWTSNGSGTFTNQNSLTLCTYTPSAADIAAGTRILTLTAVGNAPCSTVTSTKFITVYDNPTAVAGPNVQTCSGNGPVNITFGSSTTNASSATWTSSGTGIFTNPNSLSTCTYSPSADDITAGSVTLTLTANSLSCINATATKTLLIFSSPTPVAGPTLFTCSTSGAINITSGSSSTGHSSIAWSSSGSGSFTNSTSLTLCTYNPSPSDITAGSVTLTLTAYGNPPCNPIISTKTLTIRRPMTAVAGTAITTCSSAGAVNITAGSSATYHTIVTWTSSGTGTFTNPNSLTTCTYAPSAADITAGSITLTLTASNGGCTDVISTKTMTISTLPTAVAGAALSTCATSAAINITGGSSATNQTGVTWTSSGTGTFTNANSLTLCTYNPSVADKTAGSVTLTLTATGVAPCANATSTKVLTISRVMTAAAGTAISMCTSSASVNITAGSTATNHTTVTWTSSGTGTFANANSLTTCTYAPSAADITAGNVTLTLTASNAGCPSVVSTKTMTITSAPTAVAGSNFTSCYTSGAINITAGSSATNYTSITWTSSGTGTFSNPNSLTTCTYTPSAADITAGSVIFTLRSNGNAPCANVTSTKTMSIFMAPTVSGTTPGSRTGAGTVILGATASVGTLNWFANATGGSSIGSGTSFTTPVIAATTTYYVEAINGTCISSPRVAVIATVNYNEIDIQGNGNSIVSGDTTPSITDWTDFDSTNSTRTFTIRNIGGSLLTVGAITISGLNASEFTVTTPPSATVAIGASTTFTVTFAPTALGIRTANISIVNNDLDENPYTFDIQGASLSQEIDIQGNATSIVNGDTTPSLTDWTDFGSVAGTRTFTIRNTGNIALAIGAITISGTDAADFTVTTPPAVSVAAFGTTTFTVTFSPGAINTRSATITIANDDTDENPYSFNIQGFGIIPEIDVQGNATSIADNDTTPNTADWTDFSSTASTRTFTVFNNGNITLTLGSIVVSGANAGDFTVTTPPSVSVAAFSSTTFVVTFVPGALGLRTATLTFSNNDSNENPYNFNIQGTGVTREIDLEGNGLSIANGDMVTSISDHTDFGPADINLATITRTFTIRNTGSLALTISNPTITGLNASEFSISANPSTLVIGAGSSTTFAVTFNPSAVFTRIARINIANNDSNENPYIFAIQGVGLLDNDSDGIDNNVDQDDDNDGIVDSIECGTCISDPFVNGGFENTTPLIGTATWGLIPQTNVNGWQTTPESVIEIWSNNMDGGYGPVPAAEGRQFAELNANVPGTLYQTFCLNGAGGTINWSIKHRGRAGVDVAYVKFGPTLAAALASSPIVTMSDNRFAWGSYSDTYPIPIGQTSIVLTFQAGPTATGDASVGNLIDDVQIIINQNCIDSDGDTVADITDVDDDNDGIPSIEEAGFKAYSNGKATMDRTSPATWADANANGINDYIDAMITASTYVIPDTDVDGIRNHLDLDSDNDSLFDVDEANTLNGDGDINGDGKGDGADAEGDGLLNLYDNSALFGTTTRAYAQDSDSNGTPDFLQLDSNDDGINDIQTGLYGSFDTNGDGKIDGTGDTDGDGILNIFDTNDVAKGSPRDLDRKLFLDFDGRNDYGQDATALGILSNVSIMAWIDLSSSFSSTGVIAASGSALQLRVNSSRNLEVVANGTTLTHSAITLNTSQWYHVGAVFNGATVKLYINGVMVNYGTATSTIASSVMTLGKNPSAANNYFKGKIDEVRVFNVALTDSQFQRMVYQEIQNTGSQVRGTIVPKDIEALPYANLLRYYRMDAYKDDIVDNLTTTGIDTGTGMKIYNHKLIKEQEAPMPFVTRTTGTFATAVNDATKDIRGMDVTDYDYSIVQVKHNITETANSTDLAMFVDPGVTITMNNDTKIQNNWYLKLDGKIDLQGKSQLVQNANSELDATSIGSIEKDQQGQSNKYNYNYWSSPVGALSATTNNNPFTVSGVLRDGTDPNNIQNITWTTDYDGIATSPITLSNYWIFKFQNLTPDYANWGVVGENGTLQAAQGFTMKGTNAGTESQNYTFVGKPNNGTITIPVAPGNLNLCGNPYPSALDADAFISANIANINGSLYFWEHFNTNTSHNLLDYQGGYAARNLVGGTPPVAPSGISGMGSSTRVPSRFIPVGQGFLVYGSATGGNITFNNNQRGFVKETDPTSNVLFRQNTASIVDKNFDNQEDRFVEENTFTKIRLGFNSANNFHRQILLGFMNEYATEGFDVGYDAPQLDIQPNDFYFSIPGANLVIQGVDAFNESKILPLSIKNGIEGTVKFTLDDTENFDENQNIYIYDNVTEEYHDIRNNDFEINLPIGTFDTRFSLRFSSSSLGVNESELNQNVIVAFTNNDDTITIKNSMLDATIQTVELYNMLGQSIRSWNVKDKSQAKIQIPVTNASAGAYIVKVHTSKGDLNKKIIIK